MMALCLGFVHIMYFFYRRGGLFGRVAAASATSIRRNQTSHDHTLDKKPNNNNNNSTTSCVHRRRSGDSIIESSDDEVSGCVGAVGHQVRRMFVKEMYSLSLVEFDERSIGRDKSTSESCTTCASTNTGILRSAGIISSLLSLIDIVCTFCR